jgi:hypothetical protein
MFLMGALAAALGLALHDAVVAVALFTLFAIVGATWRSDMLPIIPACLAMQWVAAASGYIYYINLGEYPGGAREVETLGSTVLLSMAGLAAVAAGLRIGMHVFSRSILAKTMQVAPDYNIGRLLVLTIIAFSFSYVFDIVPNAIWAGGAQIINGVLTLRFIPYLILIIAVLERRRGYGTLAIATAWVMGPQLLTGFSDFKEIMIVIIVAMLARWRPWIRSARQAQENFWVIFTAAIGAVILGVSVVVWTGAVKQEWRSVIWNSEQTASPTEQLGQFFAVVGDSSRDINMADASEELAGRASSGALYFAYVTERVPAILPYENGRLLNLAVANATQPRFLFPEKPNLGGDSWLVRAYAGVEVAGDESATSIGLGYMAEFYIDYGPYGVAALCFAWGLLVAAGLAIFARIAAFRDLFFALTVSVTTGFLTTFDASFIKMLAGFLLFVIISASICAFIGRPMLKWVTR